MKGKYRRMHRESVVFHDKLFISLLISVSIWREWFLSWRDCYYYFIALHLFIVQTMSINPNVSRPFSLLFNTEYIIYPSLFNFHITNWHFLKLFLFFNFSYFTALVNLIAMAYEYLPCLFPIPYGCWCGITIPFPAQNDPIDEYDALCKSHDYCYEEGIAAVKFKSNFHKFTRLCEICIWLRW